MEYRRPVPAGFGPPTAKERPLPAGFARIVPATKTPAPAGKSAPRPTLTAAGGAGAGAMMTTAEVREGKPRGRPTKKDVAKEKRSAAMATVKAFLATDPKKSDVVEYIRRRCAELNEDEA